MVDVSGFNDITSLKHFHFWCQKVLPLVYDESLSYYEVLCKVVDYINKLIDTDNAIIGNVDLLIDEVNTIKEMLTNMDEKFIAELVKKYIATMIFVEISDNGHIVYYIPESWKDINFKTTGYDYQIPDYDFGHLVLTY